MPCEKGGSKKKKKRLAQGARHEPTDEAPSKNEKGLDGKANPEECFGKRRTQQKRKGAEAGVTTELKELGKRDGGQLERATLDRSGARAPGSRRVTSVSKKEKRSRDWQKA